MSKKRCDVFCMNHPKPKKFDTRFAFKGKVTTEAINRSREFLIEKIPKTKGLLIEIRNKSGTIIGIVFEYSDRKLRKFCSTIIDLLFKEVLKPLGFEFTVATV
jgi:hypothetical protein